MIYLKYHSGYETGKNLLEELNKSILVKKYKNQHLNQNDVVVRWGDTSNSEIDGVLSQNRILNKASAISKNTNKLKSLKLFGSSGLNIPKIFESKQAINRFPVLGRDKNHHGGLDIVIINGSNDGNNNLNKIPNKDFYVEVIKSIREYRVHIFNDEVIRVTRKVFRGHDKDGVPVTQEGIIKNDTYGWGHNNVNVDNLNPEFISASKKALKAIGLDFGAVDLLISTNEKPYVLEVNSSPRLNSIGLEIYAEAIKNYVDNIFHKPKKDKIYIKW